MNSEYHFRSATPDDAAELLAIYAPYVEHTAITFEYDVPSLDDFRSRIQNTLQKYPYLVAINENGTIDGYAYASSFHPRKAYEHCAELSIYLREDVHHHGLGTQLYNLIEEKLKAQGILNEYACIATTTRVDDSYLTNISPCFHEHLGFKTIGHFSKCGYKFGLWYDMIWMEKMIGNHVAAKMSGTPTNICGAKNETSAKTDICDKNNETKSIRKTNASGEYEERELIDIYDASRNFTGRTMIRGEATRPGDYHLVIHVCIFDKDGNMLIQQRAHEKAGWPDRWDFSVGGLALAGETSRQAAERELSEELGLHISLEQTPYFTVVFSTGFDDFYFIEKDIPLTDVTMQKEEVQHVKYASEKEIVSMIKDGTFIDYHEGIVQMIYDMRSHRGNHQSGTKR